jgi:ATP-dependent Clp protease protease subunit
MRLKNKNKNIYGEPKAPEPIFNESSSETEYFESDYDINTPEYLFKQIEYGINIDNEVIYLHGQIKSCETLYNIMQAVNLFTKYRTPENINNPITISLNSEGGDIFEMYGIIDYLNSLSFKVNIVCRGQACSAAAWILAMGTGIRAMSKYSTLMLHEGFYSMEDKFHSMKSSMNYFNHLETVGIEMLKTKTGIETEFWKENCKVDWYLTAEEALKLKLIDKII